MKQFDETLKHSSRLHIQQIHEAMEIVFGFETRNKYKIFDESMNPVAYAAEENTGITGALLRGMFGHWRTFNIQIFNPDRQLLYRARFPFRWFFKTLILEDDQGNELGQLQQRFAFFQKKFDVMDKRGRIAARIASPWFKLWTFEFTYGFKKLGVIEKKWAGMLSEFFTDKDNYIINFRPEADEEVRPLMLAMCLMVDIVYFENNQGRRSSLLDLGD